jgi:competence protein ComGC
MAGEVLIMMQLLENIYKSYEFIIQTGSDAEKQEVKTIIAGFHLEMDRIKRDIERGKL